MNKTIRKKKSEYSNLDYKHHHFLKYMTVYFPDTNGDIEKLTFTSNAEKDIQLRDVSGMHYIALDKCFRFQFVNPQSDKISKRFLKIRNIQHKYVSLVVQFVRFASLEVWTAFIANVLSYVNTIQLNDNYCVLLEFGTKFHTMRAEKKDDNTYFFHVDGGRFPCSIPLTFEKFKVIIDILKARSTDYLSILEIRKSLEEKQLAFYNSLLINTN